MGRKSKGHVEARSNCIRLNFTVAGKRQRETLNLAPTAPNIKAAQRTLAKLLAAIEVGCYRREDYFSGEGVAPAHTWTFRQYAESWLATLTVEKSTRRSYLTALNATWYPALADKSLSAIRYSDIKAVIASRANPLTKDELADAAKQRDDLIALAKEAGHKDPEAFAEKRVKVRKPVSGKTINNHLIPLRAVFAQAIEDDVLDNDPSAKIKNLRHQDPEPDPFDAEEKGLILSHMRSEFDERVFNYFDFAFHTGCRPSEMIVLRWSDVDWRRGAIKVHRARVDWVEKSTKTKTVRHIELTAPALAALTRMKAHTAMKRPDGEIFENPLSGEPWTDEQRQRRLYWTPALRALGIRQRDQYNTRHTFATMALMAGANPAWIARQLGHATPAMLFKRYARWIDGADHGSELAKLNNAFGGKPANAANG